MKKLIVILSVILGFNSLKAQVSNLGVPNLSPNGVPSISPEVQNPALNLQAPTPDIQSVPIPITIPDPNAAPQTQSVVPETQAPLNNSEPNSLPYSNPNGSVTSPPKA